MTNTIKKINDVRGHIGDTAADAAISTLFKKNNVAIKKAEDDISSAEDVLQSTTNLAVKNAMKALLEWATHRKEMLTQERRNAKEFIKNDKEEWEQAPINIGKMFEEIFRS